MNEQIHTNRDNINLEAVINAVHVIQVYQSCEADFISSTLHCLRSGAVLLCKNELDSVTLYKPC